MTKRIVSILTAVMLFCSLAMPITSAEETQSKSYGDFSYIVLEDGTVRINKYSGNANRVIVPAEIDGKTVTVLNYSAFRGNKKLETIELPETLTHLGDYVFYKCTKLKEIRIPDSVTEIGLKAFQGCKTLVSVTLPKNLKYIARSTFRDCTALEQVKLPSKLQSIGRLAFKSCISLKKLTLPKSLKSVVGRSFKNTPNLTLKLDKKNKSIKLKNGVLFSKDGTRLIKYTKAASKNYVVPKSVKTVAYDAFSYSHIQKVTLQKGVTVKASAFDRCANLKEVRIKKGVKKIGALAFEECKKLKKIIVRDKKVDLTFSYIGLRYVDSPVEIDGMRNVKIYGYKGSSAEKYVTQQNTWVTKANRLKFIAL